METKTTQVPANAVTEIAIYKVDQNRIPEFLKTAEKMHAELETVPGFISIETRPSVDGAGVFMDICVWETKAAALQAMEKFPTFQNAPAFLSFFEGDPIYMGHFAAAVRE